MLTQQSQRRTSRPTRAADRADSEIKGSWLPPGYIVPASAEYGSSVMWRISSLVNVKHRLIIDGGRPLFTWLDFRLIPSENADVSLAYVWLDARDACWNEAIRQGLNGFLNNRQKDGREVGYTAIEMNRVISHPIDTVNHAVEYNMTRVLEAAFRDYETNPGLQPQRKYANEQGCEMSG